jgi:two-component system sensor histidine kinase ChiS
LDGKWDFYWGKFLQPGETAASTKIFVPESWHLQRHPVLGFATYKLTILLPGDQEGISLFFPVIHSECKIWINDRLAFEAGQIAGEVASAHAELVSAFVPIPERVKEVRLVVHVSNYNYFNSGIVRTPIISTTKSTAAFMARKNGLMGVLIGALLTMFVSQILLFLFARLERTFLWLSLICLCVALRSAVTSGGSFLLPALFEGIDVEVWRKTEFLSVYATVFLVPLYIRDLFPAYTPRWPLQFFLFFGMLLCGAVLIGSQILYGSLLVYYHVMIVAAFVFMFYATWKALKDDNVDARLILFGLCFAFPFVLTEVLYTSHAIELPFSYSLLVEVGLSGFLLFQTLLLARRITYSNLKLKEVNLNLESLIASRTGQLEKSSKIKDGLLSVISHDLRSPLRSLKGLLDGFQNNFLSADEFRKFISELNSELTRTNLLVENLLSWSSNQLKGQLVSKRNFDFSVMISELVHFFQPQLRKKKISVRTSLHGLNMIFSDPDILGAIIRNILANAIKFSKQDSVIEITAHPVVDSVVIEIVDFGIGMDQATLNALAGNQTVVSTEGTAQERGTGLGLMLVDEFVSRLGGVLNISSKPGEGSEIRIILPLQGSQE